VGHPGVFFGINSSWIGCPWKRGFLFVDGFSVDIGFFFRKNHPGFRGCVRTQKKPQISRLRYAPVEMTILLEDRIPRFQEKSHTPSSGSRSDLGQGP
jgi:hypothetical protein